MATVKTIAIVGATGNMGSAIAKSLSKNGTYRLLLMSTDADKLIDLKMQLQKSSLETEVLTLDCAREASWEADIIIVATPHEAEKEVAEKIREVATGKIVISVSAAVNRPNGGLATSAHTSAAEELQKLLPHSKVVKTFNIGFAQESTSPPIAGNTKDTFIAGNNGDAVITVSEIVKAAEFNPIIAGDLSVSRMLERLQLTREFTYNWLAG